VSQRPLGVQNQLKASQDARLAADAQAREALDIAVQEEEARKQAEDERNQERARAMVLAARVRVLEARLGAATDKSIPRPTDYNEIPRWIDQDFAGRMKLLPRALRALKVAAFSDVSLVFDLLELLAVHYVDSKRGVSEACRSS
jgi:hypothetical protein